MEAVGQEYSFHAAVEPEQWQAVALSLDADPAHYAAGTGYFSSLATRAGGWWLGKLFFVASMVSNLGNYASQARPG